MDLWIKEEKKKANGFFCFEVLDIRRQREQVHRGKLFCRLSPFTHWVNTHATASQHLLVCSIHFVFYHGFVVKRKTGILFNFLELDINLTDDSNAKNENYSCCFCFCLLFF